MEDQSKRTVKELLSALLLSNRRHARYVRMLACLAIAVAVIVPLAIRQYGVTMTAEQTVLDCHYAGNGAHTHNADCYDADGNLVCPLSEKPFHTHTASCYATERVLVCGQQESAGHTHTDACYDEEGNLTCGQAETPGHTHTDACYETRTTDQLICGMEETADEHVHSSSCFKTITVEEPDPELATTDGGDSEGDASDPKANSDGKKAAEEPNPEQEFSGVLKAKDENGSEHVVLVVAAKAPKGALPKGSTMRVSAVNTNDKELKDKLDEALRREAGDDAALTETAGVDITFYDAKGNRVDPAKKVEVRITTPLVRTFSDQRTAGDEAAADNSILVMHVVDRQHTKRNDAPDAELVRKVALVNQDEDDHGTGHEDTVRFEATEFSPYVVARVDNAALAEEPEGADLEASADSDSNPEEGGTVVVTTDDNDPATPAQSFSHRVSGADGTPLLQVNVYAPEGAFPRDTTMRVSWVDPSQVEGAVAQAVAERTDGRLVDLRAVDITFLDADGNEIEPQEKITVTFASDLIDTEDDSYVVHVGDDGSAEVVDALGPSELQSREIADEADELVIESDAFSTYVVAVTTLHKELAASDGATYDITVDAPAEAGIPQDAELVVGEVAPGTAGYEDYLFQALRALGEDAADGTTSARFFDIKIVSGGEEVQPQAPVRVSVKLTGAGEGATASAVHFARSSEEAPEVLDVTQDGSSTTFDATGFSVYGIIYTVDFEYSIDGRIYQFSLAGGDSIAISDLAEALGLIGDTNSGSSAAFDSVSDFLAQVANVEFSDESLVKVTQVEGDWELESLQPFDTEESLTITMKNGDVFTMRVTDAQEIEDAEKEDIDPNKSYLICYEIDGTYYLLKNDGTVDSGYHPNFEGDTDSEHDFEHLNSTYCWSFNHIFKEQDVEHHLDKNYYLIRPIDNLAKTLTLNNAGESLVQQGNNNVAVILTDEGFILEGYHNVGTEEEHRYIHLGFENGAFAGVDGDGVVVHIYEMDNLPTYDYTVRSADEVRGTVSVQGGTQETGTDGTHYYEATSNADKKNAGTITATAATHTNSELRPGQQGYGQNKWLFDHWEQDGLPLDRNQYPATINADTLPIPFNGSNLVAYFRQNQNYVVPPSEKEPSSIEDMTAWFDGLQSRTIPLDSSATTKTAEVYDYQNRIYRVDFTSKANFETFAGNIDMAFCLDVSNSMYFPSALVETISANHTNPMPIYQINWSRGGYNGYNNRTWLDTNRGYDNPYYLIADASGTATVFKIYYKEGNWRAIDASRTGEYENGTKRYFIIGQEDFSTNYGEDARHPFSKGDNDYSTYVIYDAGDDGNNRFVYLNDSLSGSSSDLNTISNLLAVAGNASPGVRIAYNTFNKDLGSQRMDFQPAQSGLTINLEHAAGGGTRPDQAFNNAQTFSWTATYNTQTGETNRYVILVTDGAPQGYRDGENSGNTNIDQVVRNSAQSLKNNSHVKLITVGLSMDNVTSGKRLLYDLADYDSNGNKMFYMAESGSDLHNIFRQITEVLMEDAVVLGNITDTVGEGFYLVDKATGLPLTAGNMIDIEGNRVTSSAQAAGVVQPDGKTIVWTNQAIDSVAGWHGTVYVKAQEELLGGNAMNTNNGDATIVATKYRVGGNEVAFAESGAPATLNLTAELPSPKVNVNELTFFNSKTEWTVYLGEEVDPKQQLRALYDDLVVEEVVNEDNNLHYSLSPNTIEERWDDHTGTAKTFSLPGLIETLIRKDSALTAKYFNGSELKWDVFLEDMMSPTGISLPYHEYGLNDGSNIKITLEKTIAANEEDDLINKSPHETTVTGDGVENYVLRIAYEPDYTVTPIGQGGNSTEDFHTGTFGTMYQGHATGRETSNNNHVINVYAEPLDILKVDNYDNNIVPGAEFKLYRLAKDEETGTSLASYNPSLAGSYYCISSATSDANGIVHLAPDGEAHEIPVADGQNSQNLLVPGETYYLIETAAPAGYERDETVYTITVVPGPDFFTKLDGTEVETADMAGDPVRPTIAYNWDEGVTFKVGTVGGEAEPLPMEMVNHDTREAAGSGRTYMLRSDSENAYVFQMTVVNKMTPIDLNILKLDADDMADENNTNPKRLGGAVFELHELDPDDEDAGYKAGGRTDTVTTSSEEGSKGTATFQDLPAGYYEIHEVTAPDGYNLTENVTFYVKVEPGTVTLIKKQENVAPKNWEAMSESDISSLTFEFAFDGETVTATVGNTPGAVLPEAGGPGTYLYTLCGVAMLAAAGFVELTSRRKARKEAA